MDITVYIAVALALLSAIAILLVVRSRKVFEQKTTTLTTLVDTWAEQKQQESETVAKEAEEEELQTDTQEKSNELFSRIVKLMEEEKLYTNEELSRDMLAGKLCTNYKYVVKAIKDSTGNSMTIFINDYRLRHASRLLRETDESIAIVAELSGFSHRSLTRHFQAKFGITPSEYRRNHRK